MKGKDFTAENESIVEYGSDFIKCKITHDKDSTINLLVLFLLNTLIISTYFFRKKTSWYYNRRHKTTNFNSKSKHKNSNSHKHREKYSDVAEEYEFIGPDKNKTDYINNLCDRDCYKRNFHIFLIRCIYDNEMTIGDCVNRLISDKKIKKLVREIGFKHKLTIKNIFESIK